MNTPRELSPASAPPPPVRRRSNPAAGQELSLRFLASVVGQWWKFLVPITLATLVISVGLILFLFQPKYRSTAMLQVRSFQPYVVFPDGSQMSDKDNARKFMMTQVEFLRSPVVVGDALAAPGIAELPELVKRRDKVEWLAKKGLEIRQRGQSEILEVSYAGPDPRNSKKIVNAVLEAYMSVLQDEKSGQAEDIKRILRDSRNLREEEIRDLQGYIRRLQADLVTNDPSPLSSIRPSDIIVSENPLKSVQESLNDANISEEILIAQVDAIEGAIDTDIEVADILVDAKVDERPEIQTLIEQLNSRRASLNQMEKAYVQGKTDQRYQRAKSDVDRLEATLESLRAASRPRIEKEMRALARFEQQTKLNALQTDLATQRLVVQKMRENYQALVSDLRRSGGQSLTLRLNQRKLEQRQSVLDRITERIEHLETETSAPDRVSVFSEPTLPSVSEELLPWKPLLIACLASLCVPFGICALWEKSVRRVTSVEQLKQRAMVPVVGEIARLPLRVTKAGSRPRELEYELGMFEESVDSLRTGLVLSRQPESMQVLAVSSAVPGEGKSSVASQLAVSLARASGLPTLLIDGDMRSPDLHRIFQVDLGPGLAEVLNGGHRISQCINRDFNEHIHILPAGTLNKSPHKLLGRDRFKAVLGWARRHYPYIVVDTPPILAASEAMVMACAADGTLICAMRDVSRENHVKMTFNRLAAVGANPIGTVLSGVPTRQYARRYGSYVYTKR